MATIIDGKALAAKMRREIAEEVKALPRKPGMAVILVGDDPASRLYVSNKEKDCAECGFLSFEYKLPAETAEEEILSIIAALNARNDVDGILVQLPVPKHISERKIIEAIDPKKDVDAFHPENVGRMTIGHSLLWPCTPSGVMEMLKAYGISASGKHCVVIGRSNIVGKPMALLLLADNGTVTICHSRTPNLKEECLKADIIVSAVGRIGLVTADMVKEGAVVIDVAMNRNENGKFCGDVVYDEVAEKASFITPVPGGVGPMTRVMLMKNVLTAAKARM